MALPKDILWELEPHTLGKHLVLRAYLDAWFPILSSWQNRILFIDGFAGPGEYKGGEEGSPLIAMRALVDHTARIKAEVIFFFIEIDARRAQHLESIIQEWKTKLPSNAIPHVVTGRFDETMEEVLSSLDEQHKRIAPAFVMIDPFGVSGTPMSVVRRIMGNPQCEVYFSLMYEPMNRFRNTPEFEKHLDELFGCPDWRAISETEDSEERRKGLYDLYESQLRVAGANYVVHFDVYSGNRLIYSIFFATRNDVGCDRMKAAIWKVAPEGTFEFRGTHVDQLILSLEPSFEPLKKQLLDEFGNGRWYPIGVIQKFMRSDRTDYHSSQLKTNTLRPMETDGLLEVGPSTRKKAGTYPDGSMLRFVKQL